MREFIAKVFRRRKVSDYYNEGWDAYWYGSSVSENPYIEGTYAFSHWEQGWTAAEDQDIIPF